jgi:hypothetical protein
MFLTGLGVKCLAVRCLLSSGRCQAGAYTRARHRAWSYTANASLASHLDFQDFLTGAVISRNRHVPVLEVKSFIRPQAGIGHEQHEVINLLGIPFGMRVERLLRVGPRGLIELLIFFGAEPRPMRNLPRDLYGCDRFARVSSQPWRMAVFSTMRRVTISS